MFRARRGGPWLAGVALVALSACATTESRTTTDEAGGNEIQVTVENNLQPPTSVTVWIAEQIGTRRLLGDIGPADTRSFSYEPTTTSGTYRLRARTTTGSEVVSDPITIYAGESVRWELIGNVIIR